MARSAEGDRGRREKRTPAGRRRTAKKLTSAHEIYKLLVGEIGYNRNEFLYDLKLWEIRAIIKGYRNRAHDMWESARLNAYYIMSATANLRKSGIYRDTDLIRFPWERITAGGGDQPTKEEVEKMREMMRQENEQLQQKKEGKE